MGNRVWTVYMHISPSNKRYIGITSNNTERRWQGGYGYLSNRYFYNSIKKYGWDNFKHDILARFLTKEEACELEKKYIAYFDSSNPTKGYNLSTGGEASAYGTHINGKRLYLFTSNGSFIKEYQSVRECSIETGIESNKIRRYAKTKKVYNDSLIFSYDQNDLGLIPKGKKMVIILDKNGKFIDVTKTHEELSEKLGISKMMIKRRLNDNKIINNHIFIYRESEIKEYQDKNK